MRAPALLAALSLAACGGLSAEVEIDRFCFTQAVSVPFTPAPLPAGQALVVGPVAVPVPLPPLLRARASFVVRLDDATLRAVTPGVDLSGIESLRLEQEAAGGGRVALAGYVRPSPAPPGPLASITAAGPGVDIAEAARAGSLQVVLVAAGSPPVSGAQPSWEAELLVCAHARSVIDYL